MRLHSTSPGSCITPNIYRMNTEQISQPSMPFELLVLLAKEWGLEISDKPLFSEDASFEALKTVALEIGIEVSRHAGGFEALTPADFPVLSINAAGHARLVYRDGGAHFTCLGPDGPYTMTRPALLAEDHADILFVRQAHTHAAGWLMPALASFLARFGVAGETVAWFFAHHRAAMINLVIISALCNLVALAMPMFSMALYDRVIPHLAFETLWTLGLGVLLAIATEIYLRSMRLSLQDALGASGATMLAGRLYRRLLELPLVKVPRNSSGIANVAREIEQLCQTAPSIFVTAVVDGAFFVLILVLLTVIAGPVGLMPVVAVGVIYAVHAGYHRISKVNGAAAAQNSRKLSGQLIETVDQIERVKSIAAERHLLSLWERTSDAASVAGHRSRTASQMAVQVGYEATQVLTVMVLIAGVYRIAAGDMTIGELSATSLLIARAIAPMTQLISLLNRRADFDASLGLVKALLKNEKPEGLVSGSETPTIAGAFQVQDVAFSYPGETCATLQGISLNIREGEKVAIVGASGSGKSTLLKLLTRLYEPAQGAIYLDGRDVRQFDPALLRNEVRYTSQEPSLLEGSIMFNLRLGSHASDAELQKAAEVAGVAQWLGRRPEGMNFDVGPKGQKLSGGQRQSVVLASALVGGPKVLLLDEPSAYMDHAMEALIVRNLRAFTANRTLVIATHRSALLALVDRIIVMDGGRIVADGPKSRVLEGMRAAS